MIFAKPNYWKCNNYVRGRCKTSQHISGDTLKQSILARLRADPTASEPLSFHIRQTSSNAADELSLCSSIGRDTKRMERLRRILAGAESWRSMPPPSAITLRQIQDADQGISEAEKKIADSATPQPVCTAIRSAAKTLTNSSSTLEQKCEAIHLYAIGIDWDKPKTHSQFIIGLFFPNSYMLHRSLLIYGGRTGSLAHRCDI